MRRTACYGVLTEPLLIAGVEKPFAIVNGTLAIALIGDLHFYGWIVVAWLVHRVLQRITREDPFTRQIYIRYNRQPDHYEPWPHARRRRGQRAQGQGRGLPC